MCQPTLCFTDALGGIGFLECQAAFILNRSPDLSSTEILARDMALALKKTMAARPRLRDTFHVALIRQTAKSKSDSATKFAGFPTENRQPRKAGELYPRA